MGEWDGSWKAEKTEKMEMLFQNKKLVLPGSAVLKHESGISVDIISRVAEPFITN